MRIYVKFKNKTYTIQFKTILKGILVITILTSIIKYINTVDSNTKMQMANY